jgi:hypothetical protein
MKKSLILLLVIIAFGCKKKEPEPAPAPTPASAPPPSFSVKINGTVFSCSGCSSSYKSGGMYGVNFYVPNSQDRFLFSFSSYPKIGNKAFVKYGNPSFVYQKDNVYYRAVNGSVNISAIDTSSNGSINKFVCTFSCGTDTTQNVFYSFTEGSTNMGQ